MRWEPGARDRLQRAALELYAAQGFEETTVAEIATSAGLTERTFYRYFADKREVIFAATELLQEEFVKGVAAAPSGSPPLEIVIAAVTGSAGYFADDRRAYSRLRQSVITANPELHERELRKMSSLAAGLVTALRDRGVPEPAATLSAESGVTIFRLAFEQWIAAGETRTLVDIEVALFDELKALTAAAG